MTDQLLPLPGKKKKKKKKKKKLCPLSASDPLQD